MRNNVHVRFITKGEIIMNMTRWNPFKEMEDFFNTQRSLAQRPSYEGMVTADWSPSVDITEDKEAFLIKAELPEVKKEDIKVSVDKGVLTLSGERKTEEKDEKKHRIERFYGSFTRSFALPDNVDVNNINAEYKEGMLYLNLLKTAEAKPRSLEIDIKG